MHLAIIGSRQFEDYEFLKHSICTLGEFKEIDTIVSGGAKGADLLAEVFAKEYGLILTVFKPDYQRYQRKATFIRNRQIVDNADVVVAFWDNQSKGTKYTLDYAKKQGKLVYVFDF